MNLKPRKWLPSEVLRSSGGSPPGASLGSCLCSMQPLEICSFPPTEFTGISHSISWVGSCPFVSARCPQSQCSTVGSLPLEYLQDNEWVFFGDVLLSFSSSSYIYCQLEKQYKLKCTDTESIFYTVSTPSGECIGERSWDPCQTWGWLVTPLP